MADLVSQLLREILEEKILLKEISYKLQGDDDLLLQFPESTDDMYLQPGKSYEKELEVNARLYYLSIDAPEGVLIEIYRDGQLFLFAVDEIGAIQLKDGVPFQTLKVRVTNSGSISQKWMVRMLFS
jgi:hypothetical protein